MTTRTTKQRRGYGWTWEFKPMPDEDWVLCNWAAPFKSVLLNGDDSKPSDDARPVRVELVPTSKRNRKRYGY